MATERNVLYPYHSDEKIEAERQQDLKSWRKAKKKQKLKKNAYAPGSYGCHEAFHTSWVLLNSIAENLMEHPAIIEDEVWYRHAFKAHDELFRLSQEMGAGHLSRVPDDIYKPIKKGRKKKSRSDTGNT